MLASLPGAPPLDPLVARKLESAWAARPPGYKPRTRHLNPDGSPQFSNRLFLESSPYLLQHAHNPVNWYPWGAEAFDTARKLGRPVLLSVGYSTCHWCHVMEEESFEDLEIARYLNAHYVAIKVDREERPDIDAIYMAAVQSLTGGGGWPMTVWLTPDRKPFYGGTYFPARDGDRGVSTGFLTLLQKLQQIYATEPDRVAASAAEITRAIEQSLAPRSGSALPQARVLHTAVQLYRSNFDSTHGGAAGAPKFPTSLPIRFLLRYHRRTGDAQALRMATLTLEKMAAGGMYDQVGGGFHRYSTDARWLVPHFEKMLYDNALLAVTYLEAYQVTGRQDFARIAREILRYLERDMTSPQGAFYSATDADSPTPAGTREEGYSFTWTPKEIEAVLGPERARAVNTYYAVTPQGNFPGGRSILHVAGPGNPVVEQSRDLLYRARLKRPPPLRDEKILTSWNGLALSAYARAALALDGGEPRYAARAARAADFLLKSLRRNGRLLRSFKDGQARHTAYLDDYAFLIAGLLDLYEATGDPRWLAESIDLDRVLEKHYEDAQNGGYFLTADDHERLLAREKPAYDGAEPSGNSVQVLNLLRLSEFTTQDRYRQRAERALKFFSSILNGSPASLSEMLLALDFHLDTPKEIVIAAPSTAAAEPLLARLRSTFLPNRILVLVSPAHDPSKLIPLVENKLPLKGKATAYVCEKRVCALPTSDPEVFTKQLRKTQPLGTTDGHR
ncbi:MAG: thioredoxin domain-containing protein [Acidobacteria bacterium]|nr:thioredoxin domain-containing protein [Acidobacteriota bacterium]